MKILSSREHAAWVVGTLATAVALWFGGSWLFDRQPPVEVRAGWVVPAYEGKPTSEKDAVFKPGQGAFELIEVRWATQCYGNIVSVELISPPGEVDGVKVAGTGTKLDDSVVSNPEPTTDFQEFKRPFQVPASKEWHRDGKAVFRVIVHISRCRGRTPLWLIWPVQFKRDFSFRVSES